MSASPHLPPKAVQPLTALGYSRPHARMTGIGVRRGKAALSSGCKAHPATAPAGSHLSSDGGNETTIIGTVTLLVTASGVFGEMQTSLNAIWKAEPRSST